jgi:uncharacterized protein (DUF1778 family)
MAKTKGKVNSNTINLRINPEIRDLIDQAASLHGKTRTAFIVEAAHEVAQKTLLDQTLFILNEQQWEQFNQALDESPHENERLTKLLKSSPPWQ